jgi:hypothetical protein
LGAEIGWGFEEAATVPTEEFAVDEADGGCGEDFLYFVEMALAEGVGFGGEEDVEVLVAGELGEVDRGVAGGDVGGQGRGREMVLPN